MTASLPDLAQIAVESLDEDAFVARYGQLFEHSPWVVQKAFARRPFQTAAQLYDAFMAVLTEASTEDQLAVLRAHPELADKVAQADGLTEDSAKEQASAGLDRLSAEEYARFHDLNRAYRERFGFPFIICVRLHDREGILNAMSARLASAPETEFGAALQQVGLIVQLRLGDLEA